MPGAVLSSRSTVCAGIIGFIRQNALESAPLTFIAVRFVLSVRAHHLVSERSRHMLETACRFFSANTLERTVRDDASAS
jgi:hypothetical protein